MRWKVAGRLERDTGEAVSASHLNGLWVFVIFQYRNTNILIKMNKIEKKGKWDDNGAYTTLTLTLTARRKEYLFFMKCSISIHI